MQVQLTDDQRAFIREGIQTGRFAREEDAVQEALSLWEIRERRNLSHVVKVAGLRPLKKQRSLPTI